MQRQRQTPKFFFPALHEPAAKTRMQCKNAPSSVVSDHTWGFPWMMFMCDASRFPLPVCDDGAFCSHSTRPQTVVQKKKRKKPAHNKVRILSYMWTPLGVKIHVVGEKVREEGGWWGMKMTMKRNNDLLMSDKKKRWWIHLQLQNLLTERQGETEKTLGYSFTAEIWDRTAYCSARLGGFW